MGQAKARPYFKKTRKHALLRTESFILPSQMLLPARRQRSLIDNNANMPCHFSGQSILALSCNILEVCYKAAKPGFYLFGCIIIVWRLLERCNILPKLF